MSSLSVVACSHCCLIVSFSFLIIILRFVVVKMLKIINIKYLTELCEHRRRLFWQCNVKYRITIEMWSVRRVSIFFLVNSTGILFLKNSHFSEFLVNPYPLLRCVCVVHVCVIYLVMSKGDKNMCMFAHFYVFSLNK